VPKDLWWTKVHVERSPGQRLCCASCALCDGPSTFSLDSTLWEKRPVYDPARALGAKAPDAQKMDRGGKKKKVAVSEEAFVTNAAHTVADNFG
jgi:hypothetical protein